MGGFGSIVLAVAENAISETMSCVAASPPMIMADTVRPVTISLSFVFTCFIVFSSLLFLFVIVNVCFVR